MSSKWLDHLNPEQREAAAHDTGPLLILAGAGSGKTTVLVSRAGRLIDEGIVQPKRLCVLTFTNKAARELKERVSKRLGSRGEGLWAGTFHSFGLQLLRRFHKQAGLSKEFGVIDGSDAGSIVKEVLRDFQNADKTAYDANKVLELLSQWREAGRTTANKEEDYEEAAEWALPKYLKRLDHLGMVDFDSLILRPIELMEKFPEVREAIQNSFDQVMVDEFQDTNRAQLRLIQLLVQPHKNLAVVGDDDQSIYGWRGADIRNILDFPKMYDNCKVIRLEQNYRSSPEILNLANQIIAKNTQRHRKVLRPSRPSGPMPELVIYKDEAEECECVGTELAQCVREGFKHQDLAVLYRSNGQGAMLEAELRRQGVPYIMSGGTAFFDRKETRDILAYLRCAFKPNEVAFRRILNNPPRGIGEKTIDALTDYSRTRHVPFVETARRWREAGVDEKAGKSLDSLFVLLQEIVPKILSGEGKPGTEMVKFFEQIGYKHQVEKLSANAGGAAKRWRWVEIFSGILDRFIERGGRKAETIRDFLDAMELRDNIDDDKKKDQVQLLTLHACKGLEFPVVMLLGIEEDLLPHRRLGGDIDEERRLFYVGVTRAQQRLTMTRALKRNRHGKLVDSPPSRFLLELPTGFFTQREGPRPMTTDTRKSMLADLFKKLDSLAPSVPPKA